MAFNSALLGCASINGTTEGCLYIDSNAINCGPFGAQLATDNFGNGNMAGKLAVIQKMN